MTDGLLIDGFGRVFTRRAPARNCLVDIHCALMPRFRAPRGRMRGSRSEFRAVAHDNKRNQKAII
jgi:hypothetical protein